MAVSLTPGVDDQVAIMAGIGHVCVQWSLLENNILAVLCAIENLAIAEASIVFGSLDMKPRLNMAVNLAAHHKIDRTLQTRLRNLRTAMDKAKLAERRNRLVHGVHKASPEPKTFTLYMPRLKGDAQHEDVSVMDAYELGIAIKAAGDEAWSIFEDYGTWKFGDHRLESHSGEFMAAPPGRFTRFKQYISASFNRLWG